jgi:Protein of unknown function (DUF3592)
MTLWWLALGLALISAIARGFWLYRASLTWPTADGVITRLDVDRPQDRSVGGGHYFRATFTYDFRDPTGHRVSGTWYNNFSSEANAREFAERELPVGKNVVVRYSPKNPNLNDLELDSRTYAGDRPTTLSI